MNLLFIGGDDRTLFTAEFLHKKGFKVNTLGLSDKNNGLLCENIADADAVILPLPTSSDQRTVRAPLSNEVIYLDDIISCGPKTVIGGMMPAQFKDQLNESLIPYYDFYESEPLTVKNALLTAEAAISIAIKETPISLFNSSALVIGYGRIGKLLCQLLKPFGVKITATSRNDGTLAYIETDGLTSLNTDKIYETDKKFDFVFNTVPAPVLNRKFFGNQNESCFVMDLATNSGTDFAAAKEYGINVQSYPGLPGKYFPKTAGQIIANDILQYLNTKRRGSECLTQ